MSGSRAGSDRLPLSNPALDSGPYPDRCRAILSLERGREARSEISSWPGYRPTPLRSFPALAHELGLGGLWLKEEGPRFGLGSFKALGGPYGILRVLAREVERRTGSRPRSADRLAGRFRDILADLTMTCASTGNHGRSVAWGCRLLGCRCVIFVPAWVSEGRAAAIASHGAAVERVEGGYDESLARARAAAEERGWFVISDKSKGRGTEEVARDVMQGYTVLVAEALEQLEGREAEPGAGGGAESGGGPPTHVFVQAGVGGLAAAVTGHLWETFGPRRPRLVVVESERADCLRRSAIAGRPVTLEGPLDTMMGGLACAEPSPLAWEIVGPGAHFFHTISDAESVEAMRELAAPPGGDPPVALGESGAASAAGLLTAARSPEIRRRLGLGPEARRVLVIGTEGPTDQAVYERLVGHPPPEDVGPTTSGPGAPSGFR